MTPEPKTYTNRRYLDTLAKKLIIFDGAMGTSLQKQNLTAEDFGGEKTMGCNDYLAISRPQAVEKVHRSYLEAGADVIETDTFRSNRLTLGEYGLSSLVDEINTAAARLSRRLADEFSTPDHPRFVAGSIGPSGKLPSTDDPEMSDVSYDELADIFREQAAALIKGGVDLLIVETSQDILEVKATIDGIQRAFVETGQRIPLQVQVTLDTSGRMLLGTDPAAVITILEGLSVDVLGINCSTGPEYMREPMRVFGEQTILPISCLPNAGLPLNVDGQAVYPLEPAPFVDALVDLVEKNHISVVGGCCGTTPAHIRLLVDTLGKREHPARPAAGLARLSSPTLAQSMTQEPAPFIIGERLNAQGSRAFKKMLLDEDYDAILTLARQQVDNGAHGLDVCVALTERASENEQMRKIVKMLSNAVPVPLIIDSTELSVFETGLQATAGRCLINSTHLESGPDKARKVFGMAKRYNAAVIVLTIDEQGMAKTIERKLEVARRIYQLAVDEIGLRPQDLVYDTLTFTLATGDPEYSRSALETIESIRRVKQELPGVLTSLGVSNVSFGLTPATRAVLNSVMLYHCVQAGLDMAIVNPAQITPYPDISPEERDLAEDLIYNRRPDALPRLIQHFEQAAGEKTGAAAHKKDPLAGMDAAQRIHWRIVHRVKDGIDADLEEILAGYSAEERPRQAVTILNQVLLPAMKEVGDKFGAGELILPFVLQSAEVMKKAVEHVEQYLERQEGASKGLLVLATVYGDVHDIGKNLVKTILSNNGYQVLDLGKQVPAETIINTAVERHAAAIGLSALLVSTSKQMSLIVNELDRRGLNIPVLIGGAAINPRFGRRILQTETGAYYPGGVFYCKDAFDGLAVMDALTDPAQRAGLLERMRKEADVEWGRAPAEKPSAPGLILRSDTAPAPVLPAPPEWGYHVVRSMPLEMVFQLLDKNALFRLSWGAKNAHGAEWEKLQADYEARLQRMKTEALREGWIKPQAVYGFWPAQSQGNDLVLFVPASLQTGSRVELMRFSFPRQSDGRRLCLADYFEPCGSKRIDTAAFQVVTVGALASEHVDASQEAGDYSEAYFRHGLAVQTAEAAAEYLHRHIIRDLGLPAGQGKRYSWGFPAVPDVTEHRKVFELLPAAQELGMSLTSACQLVPEQSTAAIVVHHPAAEYFSAGEGRMEQLTK